LEVRWNLKLCRRLLKQQLNVTVGLAGRWSRAEVRGAGRVVDWDCELTVGWVRGDGPAEPVQESGTAVEGDVDIHHDEDVGVGCIVGYCCGAADERGIRDF